jgi:O-antigen/teichoic acid export membrane protein
MTSFSGSRLARHSVYNLLGQGVPFLAALVAIPLLIRGLGTERFGVLTIAWMVIGYFSLFDFGLSRALTQVVSERISAGRDKVAPPLVWAALALMVALGLVGTGVVSFIAPWLVHSVLKIPGPLQIETLRAFYLLAVGLPMVVVTAGLVGILTAFHRFGTLNIIRVPMGIYTFVAPLAVLPFSRNLGWVTATLVLGRLLAGGAYYWACRPLMPPIPRGVVGQFAEIRPLFRFGAWMTVTNVVGPLMVYLDRFVIGATLSIAAVAYYATPYEMVTKFLIVPGAILGVLFPAFAASHRHNREELVRLFIRGTKYIALLLFPVCLFIIGFAHEGLQWWLGSEFARHSSLVLQILAIGVFVNAIAQVAATLVQGVGRPDLSAKLHLLELPIYLPALWWAIEHHGIIGAAVVWTGRVLVDAILLFWISGRLLNGSAPLLSRMTAGIGLAAGAMTIPLLVPRLMPRIFLVSLLLTAFLVQAWMLVLAKSERSSILSWIGSR